MSIKKDKESADVSRTKAVATVPWISTQLTSKSNKKLIKLEQGDFFEEMLQCEGNKNFKLYQMLNKSFPYFLPQRFHTMDILSMHLKSANGQYWNHASHFLMLNKIPDEAFHAHLQEELECKDPDLSKFVPSFDIMGKVTQLEQCESAAEFLLEPWVLLQLPLQPVVLHQWTVALMAETLRFQKDMVEVMLLPYPSHLSDQLKQLQTILETMFHATLQLTELFFEWYAPPPGVAQRRPDSFILVKEKLDLILPELLPILEFVTSEEGTNIIKALKKTAWSMKNQLSHHDIKRGCLQTKTLDMTLHSSIYSWDFWKAPHPHGRIFYSKTAEELAKFKPLEQHIKASIDGGHSVSFTSKRAKDDFRKLIDEHIIKTGRIKGVSRDKILKAINWKDSRMNFYFSAMGHMYYLGVTSLQNFVKDENYGVMFNIINLYGDLKFEELVVGLMSVLASRLISPGVHFESVGCEGAKAKMNDIKRALASVKPNDKWLHGNLLKQVKATCLSPEWQFCPDLSQGAKLIAQHFQERIKNLVFKMIESQSKMMKDSNLDVYPECQTVQYLLPCFVASFLDLEKDESVSQEKKKKYLLFVHELIKSYEEKEFKQTLTKGWTKKGWFTLIQGKLMNWKVDHWVQNIRDCLPKEIANAGALDAFCGNVLTFLTADICGSFEANYFKWKKNDWKVKPWALQMFMFLCRISSTLENLSWLDDSRFHTVNFVASLVGLQPTSGMKTEQTTVKGVELFIDFSCFKECRDLYECCKLLYICKHQVSPGDMSCGCVQEMSIFLYHRAVGILEMGNDRGVFQIDKSLVFPVDTTDAMLWNLVHQNWWKLMHQIKGFMSRCPLLKNTTLTVTLECARKSGRYPLEDLTSDGKVKMSHPGEITFFPVEHCRWCGLVEVKEFRKCPECLQNSDYLDVNIFCSEECEKEALEKQHLEEHTRFLMENCGLLN